MDPIRNPYSPGAGSPPPELAGRDEVIETVRIATERIRLCRVSQSVVMVGLRGVGKTVLLEKMRSTAEASGIITPRIEAPENRSLPALIAPQLRQALLKLSLTTRAKDKARRALRALTGFVTAMKLKYEDIEVGLDYDPEPGLADNGDLDHDLQVLMETVGMAARDGETAVILFVDELQYVEESQLAALIMALHRAAQQSLPISLVGAGLPQIRGQLGRAKSYAERLFTFPMIGPLDKTAARIAIVKPAEEEGVNIAPEAFDLLYQKTQGYPYFLQEWGKHSWNVAENSHITKQNVMDASRLALASLDESFFRVRFDRLTPSERKYLRAMGELGAGPHRSGDIAKVLGRSVQSFGPVRNQLVSKGMIWSPNHGDTAFTVPLFDQFLHRVMPGADWEA